MFSVNIKFIFDKLVISKLFYRIGFYVFVFLTVSSNVFGQEFSGDARTESMAGASLTCGNVWSVFNNVGAMSESGLSVGAGYLNRFLMEEISEKSMAIIVPAFNGVCGGGVNYFGYSQYNQIKSVFGYAKKLGEKFNAGISISYYSLNIANSVHKSAALSGNMAMIYNFNRNWSYAVCINNVAKSVFFDNVLNDVVLPTIATGAAYKSEKILCEVDVESTLENGDIAVRTGLEINPIAGFLFRTGMLVNPFYACFGAGYNFGFMQFDFGVRRHFVLGWLPSVSVCFVKK